MNRYVNHSFYYPKIKDTVRVLGCLQYFIYVKADYSGNIYELTRYEFVSLLTQNGINFDYNDWNFEGLCSE